MTTTTHPLLPPCPASLHHYYHHHYHYLYPINNNNNSFCRLSISATQPLRSLLQLLPPPHLHPRLRHPPPLHLQDNVCISRSLTRSQYPLNNNSSNAHLPPLLQPLLYSIPTITSAVTGTTATRKWALDPPPLHPLLTPHRYPLHHQKTTTTTTRTTTTTTESAMSPVPAVSPEHPSASHLSLYLILVSFLLSPH